MSDEDIRHLRRKIVMASLAALLVSLAALISAINYTHYLQTDASLRSAMTEIANSLEDERAEREQRAGNSPKALQDKDGEGVVGQEPVDASQMMHGGRRSARTQYASRFFSVIVAADNNMLVRAKGNSELTNEYACELAQRALDSGSVEGYLDDYKYLIDKRDDQTFLLFLDCTTDLESLRQLLVVSLAVGGCAFVIAALFVVRFSGVAVRPLVESARKQKQFVADAGHELKTPLSVIATNMDILEEDLADRPEEQEWIDSTNRQVNNMRRLVDDLITLSKMEEQGVADLVLTDVSLSDVAYECVLTFEQLAHAQDKEVVPSIDEDVHVTADEPAVRQLMQILIENAIKYATGDGVIWVEVTRDGREAVFQTRNCWDHGVDARELSSLFDRFVRGEQSRDRSGGKSGYGLGLSIARALAQKNNARLEASEDDEGRIIFRAAFPK